MSDTTTPNPIGSENHIPEQMQPSPKKKRGLIIAGVAAAIVVVAGIGMVVWHESPSFCGTVCHSPMNAYVADYEDSSSNSLASYHGKMNYSCLDCHEPTIGEQVSELGTWMAGNYTVGDDGFLDRDVETLGTRDFCLNESCHSIDTIVEATDNYGGWSDDGHGMDYVHVGTGAINPHRNHMSADLECGDCHKAHEESVMVCNDCHFLPLDEGWTDRWDGAGSETL